MHSALQRTYNILFDKRKQARERNREQARVQGKKMWSSQNRSDQIHIAKSLSKEFAPMSPNNQTFHYFTAMNQNPGRSLLEQSNSHKNRRMGLLDWTKEGLPSPACSVPHTPWPTTRCAPGKPRKGIVVLLLHCRRGRLCRFSNQRCPPPL